MQPHDIRNIGISAHIDSGKTTLAERILFYTGRIHRMGEVHDPTHGASTDHTTQERRHGISIQAAATSCPWDGRQINLIDTPGHMDFTIEVERALRVLDGAVLLLCAVGGVQAQTLTVHRQMDRYQVPRLAFINKCDRPGADPLAVAAALRSRLDLPALPIQLPLFENGMFTGIIDVIRRCALRFAGPQGTVVQASAIPAALQEPAEQARHALLDALSLFHDPLMEALLEEQEPDVALIEQAVADGVCSRRFVPVLMGSAYHNQGVQPLLDACVRYLPAPPQRTQKATSLEDGQVVSLSGDPADEVVGLVFKVQQTAHGALCWVRLYQGTLRAADRLLEVAGGRWVRVGRLGRLQAGTLEPLQQAQAGDIVALFGLDLASGQTLTGGRRLQVAGMHVPEPVVEMALALEQGGIERLRTALSRMEQEDPTLKVHTDPESGEIRLRGMGELHLQIVAERLKDDFALSVALQPPQVTLRQSIGRSIDFDLRFSRQGGGPGLFAHLIGRIEPHTEDFAFSWQVRGGAIPAEWQEAVRKGFLQALTDEVGPPVIGVRVTITDGNYHAVDSSAWAFQLAARRVVREFLPQADPFRLHPLVLVQAMAPLEHQGTLLRTLLTRQAQIRGTQVGATTVEVEAEVPLAEMFGYSTALQSATGGSGAFTLEFSRFAPVRKGMMP